MRDWWLRTLLVLQRPKPVFVALRDTSKESISDRSEQVLLIVLLVGTASVLATGTAGHLMDPKRDILGHVTGPSDFDNTLVAIWAFFGGGLFGLFWYYVGGALLVILSALWIWRRCDWRRYLARERDRHGTA